jgi:hypothetical protein
MKRREATGILVCAFVACALLSGCSKAVDPQKEAAKLDRSKIDDEVYTPSQGKSTGAPGNTSSR